MSGPWEDFKPAAKPAPPELADGPWSEFAASAPKNPELSARKPFQPLPNDPIEAVRNAPREGFFEGVVKPAGRNLASAAAEVFDFTVGGVTSAVMAGIADTSARLSTLTRGGDRRAAGQAGVAAAQDMTKRYGAPARTVLQYFGVLPPGDGAGAQAMGKIMELVERDAAAVEERTGGLVQKEDVLTGLNLLMAAGGVKAIDFTGGKMADAKKAEAGLRELKRLKDEVNAEKQRQQAATSGNRSLEELRRAQPGSFIEPELGEAPPAGVATVRGQAAAPVDARRQPMAPVRPTEEQIANARTTAYELMQSGADTPKVEAAIARNPAVAVEMDNLRARRRYYAQTFGEQFERSVIRPDGSFDEYALTNMLRQGAELTPAEIRLRQQAAGRPQGMEPGTLTGEGAQSNRDPTRRPATDSGLMGTQPRGGNMLLSAPAVGLGVGAGIALASFYAPDETEQALATGAGIAGAALAARRPLGVAELTRLPDATPLGAILDRSPTTLSTLEKLPRNRFQLQRSQIEDLLKRQEVTKAERDVMRTVMDSLPPGETVTAKELMGAVKMATQDFELVRKDSQEFAPYGLERIDRLLPPDEYMGGPWIPEGATPDEIAALQAEAAAEVTARELGAPKVATHIWQSPIQLGTGNHFADPNYFAHTRVFWEGGTRHVVELQSDFAQKAEKVLTPEEVATLQERVAFGDRLGLIAQDVEKIVDSPRSDVKQIADAVRNYLNAAPEDVRLDYKLFMGEKIERELRLFPDAEPAIYDRMRPLMGTGDLDQLVDIALKALDDAIVATPEKTPDVEARRVLQEDAAEAQALLQRAMEGEVSRFRVSTAEARAKLEGSAKSEPVEPMLKNWHKRLVREELADASAAGEPMVRFATADTVAKVEGWPEGNFGDGSQRLRPEHQGIYDRYKGDVEKFLRQLGGKEWTDSAGHTWIEVPTEGSKQMPAGKRAQMFGGIDGDLAKAIAAIGAGAGIGMFLSEPENRAKMGAWGAAITGLGIFAASRSAGVRELAKRVGSSADKTLGLVSTRILAESPKLARRLIDHERYVLTRTADYLEAVNPFLSRLSELPADIKAQLNRSILTGEGKTTDALIRSLAPGLVEDWKQTRQILDALGKELTEIGKLKETLPNYYPRMVKDLEGLLKALGGEMRDRLETSLDKARREAAKEGRDLSPLEESLVINKFLRSGGYDGMGGKPGFLKPRTVEVITPELEQFYYPAEQSLPRYLESVAKEIEKARLFGEDLVRAPDGQVQIDNSIGNLLRTEGITGEAAGRVREMLLARFGPGERGANPILQSAKNLANAGLLGNATSALVQFGDTAISAFIYGLAPTAKSALQTVKGSKDRVTLRDVGLIDRIAAEFAGTEKQGRAVEATAHALQVAFKYGGFNWVDRFGKQTTMGAAWNRLTKDASTRGGVTQLRNKYGEFYGDDFPQLVADLQAGANTDLTRSVMFAELSRFQPTSKIEVPQKYLENPNGRIFYMLKSFMLKQADFVRRDVVREYAAGNKTKAMETALRYGTALAIAGASTEFVRNWLLGRDAEFGWDQLGMNVLKTFGWSEYVIDKARQGKPLQAMAGAVAPPFGVFDALVTADPQAIRYLPVAGPLIYNHFDPFDTGMTGAERSNLSKAKREAAKARKEEIDPEEAEAKRRARQERELERLNQQREGVR